MLVSFFGPQGKTLSLLAIRPFFEASTIRLFKVIFSEQQTCHRFCLAAIQVNSRAEIDFNEMVAAFMSGWAELRVHRFPATLNL